MFLILFCRITDLCAGVRVNKRQMLTYSPVLVLRVVEHIVHNRLTLDNILSQEEVHVNNRTYSLAGCTLHKNNHFCAVVCTAVRGTLWYDGLRGELQPLVHNTWSPFHVIYCEI